METAAAVIGTLLTLATAAFPLYKMWRKWKNEKAKTINIAPDHPRIDAIRERLRKRKPTGGKPDEKEG